MTAPLMQPTDITTKAATKNHFIFTFHFYQLCEKILSRQLRNLCRSFTDLYFYTVRCFLNYFQLTLELPLHDEIRQVQVGQRCALMNSLLHDNLDCSIPVFDRTVNHGP